MTHAYFNNGWYFWETDKKEKNNLFELDSPYWNFGEETAGQKSEGFRLPLIGQVNLGNQLESIRKKVEAANLGAHVESLKTHKTDMQNFASEHAHRLRDEAYAFDAGSHLSAAAKKAKTVASHLPEIAVGMATGAAIRLAFKAAAFSLLTPVLPAAVPVAVVAIPVAVAASAVSGGLIGGFRSAVRAARKNPFADNQNEIIWSAFKKGAKTGARFGAASGLFGSVVLGSLIREAAASPVFMDGGSALIEKLHLPHSIFGNTVPLLNNTTELNGTIETATLDNTTSYTNGTTATLVNATDSAALTNVTLDNVAETVTLANFESVPTAEIVAADAVGSNVVETADTHVSLWDASHGNAVRNLSPIPEGTVIEHHGSHNMAILPESAVTETVASETPTDTGTETQTDTASGDADCTTEQTSPTTTTAEVSTGTTACGLATSECATTGCPEETILAEETAAVGTTTAETCDGCAPEETVTETASSEQTTTEVTADDSCDGCSEEGVTETPAEEITAEVADEQSCDTCTEEAVTETPVEETTTEVTEDEPCADCSEQAVTETPAEEIAEEEACDTCFEEAIADTPIEETVAEVETETEACTDGCEFESSTVEASSSETSVQVECDENGCVTTTTETTSENPNIDEALQEVEQAFNSISTDEGFSIPESSEVEYSSSEGSCVEATSINGETTVSAGDLSIEEANQKISEVISDIESDTGFDIPEAPTVPTSSGVTPTASCLNCG